MLSGPDQEVVSVAWSPDGAWLAYLVSPGGSICAELHVVRPDGSGRRLLAGEDPRATVFAGHWTGPGHYVCSIASGDGPDADIVLVARGDRRAAHARPWRLPVRERGLGRRAVPAGPPRSARLPAHRRDRRRHRRPAPGAAARRPGRDRLRGRPVRPRRPLGARARLAARRARDGPGGTRRRPAVRGRRPRPGTRRPVPPGRRPGRLRAARGRHRARGLDLSRGHRAVGARPGRRVAAAADRAAGAGHAGLVAGRRRRDAGRRADRSAGAPRALGRPARPRTPGRRRRCRRRRAVPTRTCW